MIMKCVCTGFVWGQFTLSITILAGIHAIHLSMPLGKENKTTSENDDGCKEKKSLL